MDLFVEELKLNDKFTCQSFTLSNDNQIEIKFLSYGGIITQISTPDRNNNVENIVLGYKNLSDYIPNPAFLGAIIGRVGGRIANSSFKADGRTYSVTPNEGNHHLHGGLTAFHKTNWEASPFKTDTTVGVRLSHTSPDGEDGYPGSVETLVTYSLNNENEFTITYNATTDKVTPLALTNHTYFNLSGNLKETVKNHGVNIAANCVVELDTDLIPTGDKFNVKNTPFDFTAGRKVGSGIFSSHPQIELAGNGYDHYFMFDQPGMTNVTVKEENSGRTLTMKTDEPGMVFYTANNLDNDLELNGGEARKYLGLCLETQKHPAGLLYEDFPSILLKPGETYYSTTTFKFGTI